MHLGKGWSVRGTTTRRLIALPFTRAGTGRTDWQLIGSSAANWQTQTRLLLLLQNYNTFNVQALVLLTKSWCNCKEPFKSLLFNIQLFSNFNHKFSFTFVIFLKRDGQKAFTFIGSRTWILVGNWNIQRAIISQWKIIGLKIASPATINEQYWSVLTFFKCSHYAVVRFPLKNFKAS